MKERLPDITQNGVLIDRTNPQPEIRKNAENAPDWPYKDEAKYLYDKAVIFRNRFLDPIARVNRHQLPDPIIGVDNMRNYKVLAEYLVGRDAVGLSCRINFNEEHYIDQDAKKQWRFGRWAQLETMLHEYVHLWQQQVGFGREPFTPGHSRTTHNKEFVAKCEELGLHPKPDVGCHVAVATGPFAILMREWGIERPDDVPRDDGTGKLDWFKIATDWRRGVSSLTKWSCPDCGLNVRVGIKGNPELIHNPCGSVLVRAVGLTHTIYRADEKQL
jgi:hypothetical protein